MEQPCHLQFARLETCWPKLVDQIATIVNHLASKHTNSHKRADYHTFKYFFNPALSDTKPAQLIQHRKCCVKPKCPC